MRPILTYFMIAALGATAIVLIFGIIHMLQGKRETLMRSHKLMQWRVIAQAATLIIFTLIILMGRSHP